MAQHWGPVMLLHLGRVPTVVVSSAEPAKVILKTHDIFISNRPDSSISRRLLYDYKDASLPLYADYRRQMRSICVEKIVYLYVILSSHFEWVPLSESEKYYEDRILLL